MVFTNFICPDSTSHVVTLIPHAFCVTVEITKVAVMQSKDWARHWCPASHGTCPSKGWAHQNVNKGRSLSKGNHAPEFFLLASACNKNLTNVVLEETANPAYWQINLPGLQCLAKKNPNWLHPTMF